MGFDESSTIVIVGASLAGLRAAETLRSESYTGSIVLVGSESHLPYDRPPLSKQFLAGAWDLDRLQLRAPEKIEALSLDMRLGHRAIALDVEGHRLEIDDGSSITFDGLVIASGSHPRLLPEKIVAGTQRVLRTLQDSIALRDATRDPGTRMVVVGAGFVGAEVAATCRERGLPVTVVEALPVPLERALGPQMGAACAALHTDHGVDIRTEVGVSSLRADCVVLEDGSEIDADVVLVAIGVVPATEWLEGSGLELRDGVIADATLHAADHIVVAGDLSRWFDEGVGEELRIEHWTNASEQGISAARSLLAGRSQAKPYVPVPYFWSDQYDVKIQMLGHPSSDDEVVVVDGSVEQRRFVALYGRGGLLTGALAFSRPRQLMGYRQLLERRASFDDALALTSG